MDNTSYIVMGSAGRYSDHHSWIVAAFTSAAAAAEWCRSAQKIADQYCQRDGQYCFEKHFANDRLRYDRIAVLTDRYVDATCSVATESAEVHESALRRARHEVALEANRFDPKMQIIDDAVEYRVVGVLLDPEAP